MLWLLQIDLSGSSSAGGKLRVPLRGGGVYRVLKTPTLVQRRNRRRSYSGRISNESTPIQQNKKSLDSFEGNLISAGSKTPYPLVVSLLQQRPLI